MDNLILQENEKALVSAIHLGGAELPMPFDWDIFLLGIEIAGTNHVPDMERLFASLSEGDRVKLVREPENPYDEYAVRIDTMNDEPLGYLFPEAMAEPEDEQAGSDDKELLPKGEKLGYIPRFQNKVFARLMDAGKFLYGVVRHKEMEGDYHKIVVKIYMKD